MENFAELTTEKINPATINIDKCTTLESNVTLHPVSAIKYYDISKLIAAF